MVQILVHFVGGGGTFFVAIHLSIWFTDDPTSVKAVSGGNKSIKLNVNVQPKIKDQLPGSSKQVAKKNSKDLKGLNKILLVMGQSL